MKYPLLLREILRHTPNDNPDQQHLEEAVSLFLSVYPYCFPQWLEDEGFLGTRTQESWVPGLALTLTMF